MGADERARAVLGANVRRLRRDQSAEHLAAVSGVSERTINHIEAARTWPRLDTIANLAEAFDVPVWLLLMREASENS